MPRKTRRLIRNVAECLAGPIARRKDPSDYASVDSYHDHILEDLWRIFKRWVGPYIFLAVTTQYWRRGWRTA